jgi:hypothetical protein
MDIALDTAFQKDNFFKFHHAATGLDFRDVHGEGMPAVTADREKALGR